MLEVFIIRDECSDGDRRLAWQKPIDDLISVRQSEYPAYREAVETYEQSTSQINKLDHPKWYIVDTGFGSIGLEELGLFGNNTVLLLSPPVDEMEIVDWRKALVNDPAISSKIRSHAPGVFAPAFLELKRILSEEMLGRLESIELSSPEYGLASGIGPRRVLSLLDAIVWLSLPPRKVEPLDELPVLKISRASIGRVDCVFGKVRLRLKHAERPSGICVCRNGVVSFGGDGWTGPGEFSVSPNDGYSNMAALPEGSGFYYGVRDCLESVSDGRESRILPPTLHLKIRTKALQLYSDLRGVS